MWIANLGVVFIIIGFCALQFKKSTLVKSFVMLVNSICASVVAFSYYEILGNVFISRSSGTSQPAIVPWGQSLSFVLLFILAFAILQTIAIQLIRSEIDMGLWAERIGRVFCGLYIDISDCAAVFNFPIRMQGRSGHCILALLHVARLCHCVENVRRFRVPPFRKIRERLIRHHVGVAGLASCFLYQLDHTLGERGF